MATARRSGVAALLLLGLAACRRDDPRVNSNPHPQGATDANSAVPRAQAPAKADPATDSTGRPSDASGGAPRSDEKAGTGTR